jgi:cobyrinic acid a,c-diamide synthase
VYRVGGLTASYIHHYFASNPVAAAALFARRVPSFEIAA